MDLEGPPQERSRILGAPDWQRAQGRDPVAMSLSPRSTDPPMSTRITSCRKGQGEHKYQLSEHSERISLHWNQPLYRFEIAAREGGPGPLRRSASLPPERARRQAPPGGFCRGPRSRESAEMAEVTNHEAVAERAARERAERLAADGRFADLCALTEQTRAREGAEVGAIKERNYHKMSSNMADVLSWNW